MLARDHHRRAFAVYVVEDDSIGQAYENYRLGQVAWMSGDMATALESCDNVACTF